MNATGVLAVVLGISLLLNGWMLSREYSRWVWKRQKRSRAKAAGDLGSPRQEKARSE